MEELKKARKPRHDKGTIKANDRDIYLLTWTADMYAVPFNVMTDLASGQPGPGANPDGISISAVRQIVDRWRRAGWVGYQQFLANEAPWIWMTRAGLAAFGFTHYKAAPPAISRLRHISAVNMARIEIEKKSDTWISERMIRAGLYPVVQADTDHLHIPDGILKKDSGDQAIEVELTQKKPAEIYRKMFSLLHAWDKEAFGYAYTRIRYFTPDAGVKKALEVAREEHARQNQRSANTITIDLIEL